MRLAARTTLGQYIHRISKHCGKKQGHRKTGLTVTMSLSVFLREVLEELCQLWAQGCAGSEQYVRPVAAQNLYVCKGQERGRFTEGYDQ